jgi:ribosomal protein S18 acetylase RimI-like enzyme
VKLLEELGANAWPAPVNQQLEGWRLRAASGLSRRANSVLPLGPLPFYDRWPELVADFYRSRGLPPRFQVSGACAPELDGLLAERGYNADITVSVMTAPCASILQRAPAAGPLLSTRLSDALAPEWFDAFLALEYRHGDAAVYRQIMEAIGPPACYALVSAGGAPTGVGMAVAERGWVGLFNVITHPDQRRRGAATEVGRALAAWGTAQGAAAMYLQVAADNAPALSLYERLGFTTLYQYHYRTLE